MLTNGQQFQPAGPLVAPPSPLALIANNLLNSGNYFSTYLVKEMDKACRDRYSNVMLTSAAGLMAIDLSHRQEIERLQQDHAQQVDKINAESTGRIDEAIRFKEAEWMETKSKLFDKIGILEQECAALKELHESHVANALSYSIEEAVKITLANIESAKFDDDLNYEVLPEVNEDLSEELGNLVIGSEEEVLAETGSVGGKTVVTLPTSYMRTPRVIEFVNSSTFDLFFTVKPTDERRLSSGRFSLGTSGIAVAGTSEKHALADSILLMPAGSKDTYTTTTKSCGLSITYSSPTNGLCLLRGNIPILMGRRYTAKEKTVKAWIKMSESLMAMQSSSQSQ